MMKQVLSILNLYAKIVEDFEQGSDIILDQAIIALLSGNIFNLTLPLLILKLGIMLIKRIKKSEELQV